MHLCILILAFSPRRHLLLYPLTLQGDNEDPDQPTLMWKGFFRALHITSFFSKTKLYNVMVVLIGAHTKRYVTIRNVSWFIRCFYFSMIKIKKFSSRYIVESRYLELAYFELPLMSKWKSGPCFNMKLWQRVTK